MIYLHHRHQDGHGRSSQLRAVIHARAHSAFCCAAPISLTPRPCCSIRLLIYEIIFNGTLRGGMCTVVVVVQHEAVGTLDEKKEENYQKNTFMLLLFCVCSSSR